MTDRLLLQKYSDWSIVLMESFNAKRRLGLTFRKTGVHFLNNGVKKELEWIPSAR